MDGKSFRIEMEKALKEAGSVDGDQLKNLITKLQSERDMYQTENERLVIENNRLRLENGNYFFFVTSLFHYYMIFFYYFLFLAERLMKLTKIDAATTTNDIFT